MPRQRHGIRGDVGIAPYAPSTEGPCVTFGRTEPSAPTHAYRTRALSSLCHSEERSDVGIRPPVPLSYPKGPPSGGPYLSAT